MKWVETVVIWAVMVWLAACGGSPGGQGNEDSGTNNNQNTGFQCGDGETEGLEECDEGTANSDTAPNACRTDCTLARCGDGVEDDDEECDDGAQNSDIVPDVCRTNCLQPGCGDGIVDVELGETCDPGPDVPNDNCSVDCVVMYCGNGYVEGDEVCDDGNFTAGDGCSPDCRSQEECGNGIPDFVAGEQCDCGVDAASLNPDCAAPNGDAASRCTATCVTKYCGNSVTNAGEVCDDGNNISGDGCSADCLSSEVCGNGRLDYLATPAETCDCGDSLATMPAHCSAPNGDAASECTAGCVSRYCGNGVLEPGRGEVCDDGNNDAGDSCSPDCRSDESCGNGIVDPAASEQCDCGADLASLSPDCLAPNGDAASSCTVGCETKFCGNGVVNAGEACDDGNTASGDGCSPDCQSLEVCGNGILDVVNGESCDDGNAVNGDGCSTTCHTELCGNGILDSAAGEVCDDGNNLAGDGCSANCLSAEVCGNAIVDFVNGETCDDGNTAGGDGCSANCLSTETCGNGYVDTALGEQCDDGNTANADGCQSTCLLPVCGDGIQDPGEVCDDGDTVSGDGCNAFCTSTEVCGNGIVDVNEECDDGNSVNADACRNLCVLPRCGDGVQDPAEICDDSNLVSGDGCSANCLSDESCGNGVVDVAAGEQCDDGNTTGGDGCSASCLSNEQCGNGVVDPGEDCDDANTVQTDGCHNDCTLPACGDAIVDPGEVCDDGNTAAGDGCGPWCNSTEACGNGVVDINEECDDGNLVDHDGCQSTCVVQRCGDGIADAGEVCDDGNNAASDGCSPDCLSDERCGNGYVDFSVAEQCDDGNLRSHDGCSSGCTIELPIWSETDGGWTGIRAHSMDYDVARQRVVLFGGVRINGTISSDTWEYDGTNWLDPAPDVSPPPRAWTAVSYDTARQVMVLFGGYDDGESMVGTWEYDGATWTEVAIAGPSARHYHKMVYDQSRGTTLLYGGYNSQTNTYLQDTWEYNGASWSLISAAGGPGPLAGHEMVYDTARNEVVLFGGYIGVCENWPTNCESDRTWTFSAGVWSQESPATSPPSRSSFAMSFDSTWGMAVIHGGWDGAIGYRDDTWIWTGGTWGQITTASWPQARDMNAMAFNPSTNKHVHVGGNYSTSGPNLTFDDTWTFQLSATSEWVEVTPPTSPQALAAGAMAWDAKRGRVVLVGGWSGTEHEPWTWEHDGRTWRRAVQTPAGLVRDWLGAAYVSERQTVMTFGGKLPAGTHLNDVWEYDGSAWTQLAPSGTPPSPRSRVQIAYDSQRKKLVVFGGWNGSRLGGTFELDIPTLTWSTFLPATPPPNRHTNGLSYDPVMGGVLMYAGDTVGGANDLWLWDGTNWTQVVSTKDAGPRLGHAYEYDPIRSKTINFGGSIWLAGSTFLDDTWELGAGQWDPVQVVGFSPDPRNIGYYAFDAQSAHLLLFGGQSYSGYLDDTWTFSYESTWPDEQCANGVDDDGDGLVDCLDVDCAFNTRCCTDEFGDDAAYRGCRAPAAFEDIATTGTLAGSGDELSFSAPIGFVFPFHGVDHVAAQLHTNGGITFAAGVMPFSNVCMPASIAGGPAVIAVLWDDMDSSGGGQGIYYETRGTVGKRRFIVQWVTDLWNAGTQSATFQAILHEATGAIELNYPDTTFGDAGHDGGALATVGIQADPSGPAVPLSCNQAVLPDGSSLIYYPR